jgi:predicted DNA-binding protein with PD1-like motif
MIYSQATRGRTFVIRLEDGDILHEAIESFARENTISAAALIAVGGADKGSRLVVGPTDGRAKPVEKMALTLHDVYEISGTGTIFPDRNGNPILHMHLACGRNDHSVTGCVQRGVRVWHVMEVIVTELTDTNAMRLPDDATGFELLNPTPSAPAKETP